MKVLKVVNLETGKVDAFDMSVVRSYPSVEDLQKMKAHKEDRQYKRRGRSSVKASKRILFFLSVSAESSNRKQRGYRMEVPGIIRELFFLKNFQKKC